MTNIRALCKKDDLGDLIALSREFFQEYEVHHEDFFEIDELQDSDVVGYFSRWIDDEDGETFIALAAGRIVGYITIYVQTQASFWKIKRVGAISGLMVQPDYRRRGIASQLLAQARDFLKGRRVFHRVHHKAQSGGPGFLRAERADAALYHADWKGRSGS